MAKKRVSVYMREEDLEWLARNPAAESVSGSAVLIMEWSMTQIQRGAITALEKLDEREEKAIIKYAKSAPLMAGQDSYMFSTGLLDWFRLGQRADQRLGMRVGMGWENPQIAKLVDKIREMTPSESMGLFCWARGQQTQGSQGAEQ